MAILGVSPLCLLVPLSLYSPTAGTLLNLPAKQLIDLYQQHVNILVSPDGPLPTTQIDAALTALLQGMTIATQKHVLHLSSLFKGS